MPSVFFSSKSFQIPSQCILKRHCFQNCLGNSKSFQIPSECILQRHCFQNVLCSSKSFQMPSECILQRHCFQHFLCSSKSFQISSKCMRQRHYPCYASFCICFHHFSPGPRHPMALQLSDCQATPVVYILYTNVQVLYTYRVVCF